MLRGKLYDLALLVISCVFGLFPAVSQAALFKVLVVMSYHEDFYWSKDIKEGIDRALRDKCDITYFYMDTKNHFEKGEEKALEAYKLYQKMRPRGVIASDDNAQSMFVVPYLKNKVSTPIIFCGVNEAPEKYGYPASNVTGVLERSHLIESLSFLKQLVPSVKSIGFMMKDNPTSRAFLKYFNSKSDSYPVEKSEFELPGTLQEAISVAKDFKTRYDALFIDNMGGLPDENGTPLTPEVIIPKLLKLYNKPTLCANMKPVKLGVLCAIIKVTQEQGILAGEMLLKAMEGTRLSQLPIIQNHKGKAVINVTTMKALGIRPAPMALQQVELIKTEE
ncbi:ABC transporter substrate-binding protein [Desulfonema magnum]|uniref:ABC transporter, substrate-binding protein n=1 Tax=Desulfonema magnum TaxID=45655 RepID=A0A975GME2_9BACT|nr:ABC transporter substrate binding protein [Desulfonema magnum]QTA86712.1 putative ABC transporter, substrate-binding protein [Desulfonema magnum]